MISYVHFSFVQIYFLMAVVIKLLSRVSRNGSVSERGEAFLTKLEFYSTPIPDYLKLIHFQLAELPSLLVTSVHPQVLSCRTNGKGPHRRSTYRRK